MVAATVKSYIGSLSQVQQLIGLPGISVNQRPLLKRFLKGVDRNRLEKPGEAGGILSTSADFGAPSG